MNIFRRPDYKSEATQFIDQLKVSKPGLEAQQRQGRSLLWDKSLDRDAIKEIRAGQVPQKPYVYQTSGK
ncbi:MAG: acetyl-CoA carboxyl transferase [Burkholderiales bacterium RIFCSPLOWO2_12_FULL_61_40]|nr:MAG: acetyl-CoA carboxyl transferase [Burkholderiales bacterium RIFCSPLOWO2_12_FULL_61_40]